MTNDPRDTPEARAHFDECRTIQEKLETFIFEDAEEPSTRTYENDTRPALSVVPTLDGTGRVKMTIDDLCSLLGVTREELRRQNESLWDLL